MSNAPKQQRVRTGCLTCRSRRKKCDEGKPVCKNCSDRGLSCRYGLLISFKETKVVGVGSDHGKTLRDRKAYRKFKAYRPPSLHGLLEPHTALSHPHAVYNSTPLGRSSPPQLTYTAPEACIAPASSSNTSPHELSMGWPSSTLRNNPASHQYPPEPGESPPRAQCPFSSHETSESNTPVDETALVRHYRYAIAPWLDLGDLDQPFGVLLLRATTECEKLYHAILALSARHLELFTADGWQFNAALNTRLLGPAPLSTESASESTTLASFVILELVDYLSSTPQEWRSIVCRGLPVFTDLGLYSLDSDISKALFWFWLRMDLAAAVVSAQPPLMSLVHLDRMLAPGHSLSADMQHIIFVLCCSLHDAFDSPNHLPTPSSPQTDHPFLHLQNPSPVNRWKDVWNKTQRWYEQRRPELKPILDLNGAESENIDPDNESMFPIILFTTSLALIANVDYHISCLVLLDHKPRSVQLAAGSRSLTSTIWHAQRIVGIADCNRLPDCWDPLFLAGLLVAAKRMSHASQHAVILNTLRINRKAVMKLDQEIVRLETDWRVLGND